MLTSIAGRSVVVTGASKGIGKGIARVFARQGRARCCIVARAPATDAESDGEPRSATAPRRFAADVTQARRHGGAWLTAAVEAPWRHRHALRQCRHLPAGQARRHDAPRQWDEVLATNLKGMFLAVQGLPARPEADRASGRVVVTSLDHRPDHRPSRLDRTTAPRKAGQLGFLRTAAIELARHTASPSTRCCPATS